MVKDGQTKGGKRGVKNKEQGLFWAEKMKGILVKGKEWTGGNWKKNHVSVQIFRERKEEVEERWGGAKKGMTIVTVRKTTKKNNKSTS